MTRRDWPPCPLVMGYMPEQAARDPKPLGIDTPNREPLRGYFTRAERRARRVMEDDHGDD